MQIRVAKAKFGPMTKRYNSKKSTHQPITEEVKTGLEEPNDLARRGVAAGLDNSHNRDYKVTGVSDPLLIIHVSDTERTHKDLKNQLERLNLWNFKLIPIELPRTSRDGEQEWVSAFKTPPRDSTNLDVFKNRIRPQAEGMCFESNTDIEAHIPDIQQSLSTYAKSA